MNKEPKEATSGQTKTEAQKAADMFMDMMQNLAKMLVDDPQMRAGLQKLFDEQMGGKLHLMTTDELEKIKTDCA